MDDSLGGRLMIVTGAAGGLGTVACEIFRSRGAEVLGVDVKEGADLQIDASTPMGAEHMVAEAVERLGGLNAIVLNATTQHLAPLPEFTLGAWNKVVDVGLTGPFLSVKAAWPALAESGDGRIIATASLSSMFGERDRVAYVAAKHGLLGLVRAAALEGAGSGITANAVAPSWMRTPLVENQIRSQMANTDTSERETLNEMLSGAPRARFVAPAAVANVMAFLAGADADYVNGVCIPVDDGESIGI